MSEGENVGRSTGGCVDPAPGPPGATRRAVLRGGVAVGGLVAVLASCDPVGTGPSDSGGEAAPAPPDLDADTRLDLEPLTTSYRLIAEHPVLRRGWAVSPTADRGMAVLLLQESGGEWSLEALRPGSEDGLPVPIAPDAAEVQVDPHGATVRVLVGTVAEDRHVLTLLTSKDLEEWSSVEVEVEIPAPIAAAGDGVLVTEIVDGSAAVIDVADDGVATPLGTLRSPEGERWTILEVSRREQTLTVLVDVTTAEADDVPHVVVSVDGGASWDAATVLESSGAAPWALNMIRTDERVVISGTVGRAPEFDDSLTIRRPVAWTSEDGASFAEEDVPLPGFGRNGWTYEGRGDVDADTPADFLPVSAGAPVLSEDRKSVHLAVSFYDDCRRASRAEDGSWTVSEREPWIPSGGHHVEWGVADPSGSVLGSDVVVSLQRPAEEPREARTFLEDGLLVVDDGQPARSPAGLIGRSWMTFDQGRGDSLDLGTVGRTQGVAVDGDQLTETRGYWWALPGSAAMGIHHVTEELSLGVGERLDDGNFEGASVVASADGENWEEASGVPDSGGVVTGVPRWIGDRCLLPLATWDEGDRLTPHVFASEDGIAWSEPDSVDLDGIEEASGGAGLRVIVEIDETPVGLGWVRTAEEVVRPASFLLQDGAWKAAVTEVGGPGWSFLQARSVNGELLAEASDGSRVLHAVVSADGTAREIYRSTDHQRRRLPVDVGDGVLVATGRVDHPAGSAGGEGVHVGIGTCLWASADGGASWGVTRVPGLHGRYRELGLVRDEEDLILLVGDPDTPHGYRIPEPRGQLLGAAGG